LYIVFFKPCGLLFYRCHSSFYALLPLTFSYYNIFNELSLFLPFPNSFFGTAKINTFFYLTKSFFISFELFCLDLFLFLFSQSGCKCKHFISTSTNLFQVIL